MTKLCAGTPKITVRDNRGLTVRTLRYNRGQVSDVTTQYVDVQVYNALGQVTSGQDPRFFGTATKNFEYTPALSGQVIQTVSADAGTTKSFTNIEGHPVWEQSRGRDCLNQADDQFTTTREYDALGRPTVRWVNICPLEGGLASAHRTDVWVYGESRALPTGVYDSASTADPRNLNQRGRLLKHYDTGGVLDRSARGYHVAGKVLRQDRQLLSLDGGAFNGVTHGWNGTLPDVDTAGLDPHAYGTTWTYNAMAQVLTQTDAKGHQQQTTYDMVGRRAANAVTPNGGKSMPITAAVSYTAGGQIETQIDANGVQTVYTYEPQTTQRVLTITITRSSASASAAKRRRSTEKGGGSGREGTLQDLAYTYDGVGNVIALNDASTPVTYFHNGTVDGSRSYSYDALYQLVSATGRENSVSSTPRGTDSPDAFSPLDQANYRSYRRNYRYDFGGNLCQVAASNASGTGAAVPTRNVIVAADSNRALSNVNHPGLTPTDLSSFFDSAGQSTCLDGNANQPMYWTPYKQLYCLVTLYREDTPRQSSLHGDWYASDCELYAYGGDGQRVRKVAQTNSAGTVWTHDAIYLPGLELRQNHQTGEQLEVIVLDGGARLLNWISTPPEGIAQQQIRYRYSDRQNSCQIETDENARIITQEEYYPYGGTAVWAAASTGEAKCKTIHYSAKERDSTGLYYYGFRYYQPWIARWVNPDPAGTLDGRNRYCMVGNNPATFADPTGLWREGDEEGRPRQVAKLPEIDVEEWIEGAEGLEAVEGLDVVEGIEEGVEMLAEVPIEIPADVAAGLSAKERPYPYGHELFGFQRKDTHKWLRYDPIPLEMRGERQVALDVGDLHVINRASSGEYFLSGVDDKNEVINETRIPIASSTYDFVITVEQSDRVLARESDFSGKGHSSLAAEKDVLYAGEIGFDEDGKLMYWSNASGHYRPDPNRHRTNIPPRLRGMFEIEKFEFHQHS
ncbi:RHS repeat-associated core domain-containing protein [Achromobacter aloeverae]|uniref:RHS repeat protein n=1 Tax=Achromobacter aloeverae TaxID=1750518 RepID=A0A4Q1HLK9_9BURK|nr:RHS repeat-associated core domain-containing protein [Achromobacter aloeverae]RXN90408.1 hypothetical protein C7R54_12955 [Achromobacter aloeverae]